jgi:hypothetical protein
VVDPWFAPSGFLRTLSREGEYQHLLRRLRSSGHCEPTVLHAHMRDTRIFRASSYHWYDPNRQRQELRQSTCLMRPKYWYDQRRTTARFSPF